jgi:uncharacterized protein YukE
MGEMWGADLAQLRNLAREFDAASHSLDNTVSQVTSMLDSVPWMGPSGDQFRAEWDGLHVPALRNASTGLAEARSTVERNADDQERTSEDYAGGGTGGPAGGGIDPKDAGGGGGGGSWGSEDDGNWAQTVLDVVEDANWGATVAGLFHNAAELATRWTHGIWGVADALPGGWGGAIGAAGKAFAWGSVAFGAWQMGEGLAKGDYWKVGDGAMGVALGAGGLLVAAGLVSNPIGWTILGVGAAWAIADLAIDGNITEAAWKGAGKAAEWVGDTAGDIAEGVSDVAGDVLDAGGDLIDGARDLLPW